MVESVNPDSFVLICRLVYKNEVWSRKTAQTLGQLCTANCYVCITMFIKLIVASPTGPDNYESLFMAVRWVCICLQARKANSKCCRDVFP